MQQDWPRSVDVSAQFGGERGFTQHLCHRTERVVEIEGTALPQPFDAVCLKNVARHLYIYSPLQVSAQTVAVSVPAYHNPPANTETPCRQLHRPPEQWQLIIRVSVTENAHAETGSFESVRRRWAGSITQSAVQDGKINAELSPVALTHPPAYDIDGTRTGERRAEIAGNDRGEQSQTAGSQRGYVHRVVMD